MPQRYLPPAESRFLGKLRNSVSSRRAPREQQAHKDQVQPTCPRRRTQIYEESGLNDRAPIKQGRSRALGLHPVPRPNDPLEPSTIVLLEQFFGFAQRALLVDAWVRHPLKSIRLDKVDAIRRHYRDVALAWQGGAGVPPYEQGAGTVVAVDIERFGNPQAIYVMLTIPDDTAVPGVGVVHLEDARLALHERRDAGAEPAVTPNNVCRWRRASRYPRGRGVCEPAALPYDVRTTYASFAGAHRKRDGTPGRSHSLLVAQTLNRYLGKSSSRACLRA